MKNIKSLLFSITPPLISNLILKNNYPYGYFGNYDSWKIARSNTSGYDSKVIIDKVYDAAIKVKNGEGAFERDSVVFDEPDYSWPLLAIIQKIFTKNEIISIIDFGGSLGSSYFQHIAFLKKKYSKISWNVVEQKHYVKIGKKEFANKELKFFFSINECLKETKSKVIYLSGTLQYLQNPSKLISELKLKNFDHIILDRTAFIENNNHRITIQKVPPSIYQASYPCWMFNFEKLINEFAPEFKLNTSFPSYDGGAGLTDGTPYALKGVWLERVSK